MTSATTALKSVRTRSGLIASALAITMIVGNIASALQ